MNKPYIIAEVGTNHNGSLKTALKFVKELSKIGADAVKFQIADPEEVFSKHSFSNYEDKIKKIKKRLLTYSDHIRIYNTCRKVGVDYLCSAFDLKSLKFLLKNFKMKYLKIPSGEIKSYDILKYISKTNYPLIISTGMTYEKELKKVLKVTKRKKSQINLLYCVSSYPAKINQINLNNIIKLKKLFKVNVGYSDHYPGIEASIISSILGANIIEKHVTFRRNAIGPDHKSSCTIKEFKEMIKIIRKNNHFLSNNKKLFDMNFNLRKKVTKSIVARKNLISNQVIKLKHIAFKRPGNGISPQDFKKILNKKIIKKVNKNELILLKNVK